MQLTKAIEQITSRAKSTGLRTALSELARELGSGLLPALLRSIAGEKSSPGASGQVGNEPAHSKYVFNIAVSVAVGVPVNKADGEAAPEKDGQPDSPSGHGEGAPAIATATVHALRDASEPRTSAKLTTRREARKTGQKTAAKK